MLPLLYVLHLFIPKNNFKMPLRAFGLRTTTTFIPRSPFISIGKGSVLQ